MNQVKKQVAQPVLVSEAPEKVKRASPKTRVTGVLLLLMSGLFLAGFSYQIGAAHYQRDLLLAREGVGHLLQAEKFMTVVAREPFNMRTVAATQQEFAVALRVFTQIENDLRFLPAEVALFPLYGPRLHAALHLIPLARALSEMGDTSCNILSLAIARLQEPLHARSQGITLADLSFITQSLDNIHTALTTVSTEANQLTPSDMQFDPRVSKLVDTLRMDLPTLHRWIADMRALLPVAPTLLGINTSASYLIEILDSTELRPGGGFIGNYGIVALSGGQLATAYVTDTDLLDAPFGASGNGIHFPPAYRWFDIAHGNWGLRDSNLDADFPTAAQSAQSHYLQEGGDTPVQGVIAITPSLIQRALILTGPIAMPEYHEVITAQNLVERIHYHQLGRASEGSDNIASPDGHSSLRKHFTALLAEHFLTRIRQIAPAQASKLLLLLANGMHTKDFQIYFANPQAEKLLHNAHLDAAIQVPDGDDLLVVDANIGANKANPLIKNTLIDDVSIDSQGNATHHATLRYAWTLPGQDYGLSPYRDYVRIYVPETSVLSQQQGWQQRDSSQAFGHKVWAGFFTLTQGETRSINLTWYVAHVSTHSKHDWHYQNIFQKQASTNWTLQVRVTLPYCARITRVSGNMHAASERVAVFNQVLTENTSAAIDYTGQVNQLGANGACPPEQNKIHAEG